MRKDALPVVPCEWCGMPFRAVRYVRLGTVQRFCVRACFNQAKRAWGVIRRAV